MPHHGVLTALIVASDGRILLGQRPADGLLGGLWEFISSDLRADYASEASDIDQLKQMIAARAGLLIEQAKIRWLGEVKHAFTHFRITRRAWIVALSASQPAAAEPGAYACLRWLRPEEVPGLALARSDQKLWQMYQRGV